MPTPTKYAKSITTDFTGLTEATPDLTTLQEEISASSISIAVDYIDMDGDTVDIWFKDVLSSGDQTTLQAIVEAHTGVPNPEDIPAPVQVNGFQELTGYNIFRKGYNITATAEETLEHEVKYTENMMLQGIGFKLDANPEDGDYVEVEMVDVDNILGYGADFVLGQFAATNYVWANWEFECCCSDAKLIPAGIYVRFRYESIGSVDVNIKLIHILRTCP